MYHPRPRNTLSGMIRAHAGHTPQIDPTAFVSEMAYVVGDVVIGAHSSVWPGAVIRGDHGRITIGSHTNVQDNSVVHSDAAASIGDHVTIGHRVVCHATVVGSHVLLGNGCVLNDGVAVENTAIVAAGAVVLEGTRVATSTIVAGVPARMRGRLMQRHLDLIEVASANYVALGARYKAEGLE